jgi:ferredoxin/flavodoxin
MKKIIILYFSGAGATKKVAELMCTQLSQNCKADMFSVESDEIPGIENYDGIIIGTPTYHAAPAKYIMNYFKAIPQLKKEIPAFIYTTRGMASLNTNRILAKKIREKNIITIMDRAYRSPASDGSIIAPFIKRFYKFEKGLKNKTNNDCKDFLFLLNQDTLQGYIPRFQFGSILNAPNKAAGHLITLKIFLHKDKCIKCNQCIEKCPHKAFAKKEDGYPFFTPKDCDNCYRCIHHCPNGALSLFRRKSLRKRLDYDNIIYEHELTSKQL